MNSSNEQRSMFRPMKLAKDIKRRYFDFGLKKTTQVKAKPEMPVDSVGDGRTSFYRFKLKF